MKIIFAGTPDFAVPVLTSIYKAGHDICAVYTQPDRPKGRGRKVTFSPVKEKALEYNLPIVQVSSLKSEQAQNQLRDFEADLMVVVAYGLLLPKPILDAPRLGCFNVHASLLPKYRGASPIQAAILNGDLESGVTIMKMDIGLDTGDMVLKKFCQIELSDTAQSLHDKLAALGAQAIGETLALMEADKLQYVKQDDTCASYASKISKEDACIDWQQSASDILNMIRAYNPWPVAYTHFNDQVTRIWQAAVISLDNDKQIKPGSIIELNKKELVIACGRDAISIQTIQLPGGKPMSIDACLNAKRDFFEQGLKQCQD